MRYREGMGRKRARKAERRQRRREGAGWWSPGRDADGDGLDFSWPAALIDLADRRTPGAPEDDLSLAIGAPLAGRTCGRCREFVEDGELGRGTCLHPGSGVLHPWTDTPGCDFWAGSGRVAERRAGM
jgi:hypothetical protein